MLATRVDVADAKALREVADQLRDKLGSGVIVLAGVEGDKIALVAMVTPDLVEQVQRRQDRRRGGEGGRRQGRRTRRHGAGGRVASRSTSTRPWRACSISFVAERGDVSFVIGAADEGATLAAALRRQLLPDGKSWEQVRRLCTTGKVFVDDERALDPARRVRAGQRVVAAIGRRRGPT